MADMFPTDSAIRRVNLEPAVLLGAGRALLLQLAHPVVAQGVQDHSEFRQNPFKRLQGTLEATYAAVYGSEELAHGVGRRIRWIHDFITGPTYRANDPQNLLWVHATLVDTALGCHTRYVGRLPEAVGESYYRDMMRVAELFGVPLSEQPKTLVEFRGWFDDTVAAMEITPVGKDLAEFILDPALPFRLHVPFQPLLGVQRLLTLGQLPASIRDQLGQPWTDADHARLAKVERRVRATFRSTPRAVRTAGPRLNGVQLLWMAARHVRQFEERQASRPPDAA